ncbi:hypothetical protein ACFO0A_12990 [Novosphingobium tardum]|uniref:Sarcosine oxidase subunit gamma n=1 Tax=Novosphingobium tardum TaxID=1538021 RepID=A0ABV8RSV9_9SPHN
MANLTIGAFSRYVAKLPAAVHPTLTLTEWTEVSACHVIALQARAEATAAVLGALPRDAHILHTGIGQWLVIVKGGGVVDLTSRLHGLAKTFDQSAASGILEFEGHDALRLLQKGVFVDLTRTLDMDGSCLVSVIAHVPVTMWRISSDRFGIAVPRSYVGSFWHWLEASAAADAMTLSTLN